MYPGDLPGYNVRPDTLYFEVYLTRVPGTCYFTAYIPVVILQFFDRDTTVYPRVVEQRGQSNRDVLCLINSLLILVVIASSKWCARSITRITHTYHTYFEHRIGHPNVGHQPALLRLAGASVTLYYVG